jgi:hypothetical protein
LPGISVIHGVKDEFDAGRDAKLFEDPKEILFYDVLTGIEFAGNLAVAQALETWIHTLLSTMHALTQQYDIVHYHTLGAALFSFIPRLLGGKTAVTVQGLDWQRKKWGRFASGVLRLGEQASAQLPNTTVVVSQALQRRYRDIHRIETF